MKYACEGILLVNYYTKDTPEMYAEYMASGAGIGYENWLYETTSLLYALFPRLSAVPATPRRWDFR